MSNLGWLFYKDYFKDIDYANLSKPKNQKMIQDKVKNIINQSVSIVDDERLGNIHFKGTTTYPGLILGSGNAHELPSIEGQAILGFHFDYTSGLPVIQGSSIKGVLRSVFEHPEYVQDLLDTYTVEEVADIKNDIFNNADIFYDAHIIKAGVDKRILGDDYLTPHHDPLKDPIPLRFIKVLPDVTFLFQFELLEDGILTKDEKAQLFKHILGDLGLGAKTNVGYGKFTSFDKAPRTEEEKIQDKIDAANSLKRKVDKRKADIEEEREAKKHADEEKKNRLANAAQDKLDEEEAKKQALASQGLESVITDVQKFKALESILKKYIDVATLSEDDKSILESHVKNMTDKIKRRKFPYAVFNNDKCLGKERTEALVSTLGLK